MPRSPRPEPRAARAARAATPATRLAGALGAGLGLCLVLPGCSAPSATSDSYFPLDGGHRWQYTQTIDWENNTREQFGLVLTTEGRDDLPLQGQAWRRRSDSGVDYWLREDETGIYRIASKSDIDAEPLPDKPVRHVLKTPLQVGTSWQASTTAYLLKRNAEFPPEIRHTHKPVTMTYQIDALGQKLSTPAGDFADCIRVQGQAVMKLFADPVVGFRDMPLVTTEWYCKGVGLARLERSEPAGNSTFLQGGKLVMELVQWR